MRKRMLGIVAVALGAFFAIRAVAEPFVIDVADPPSYARDWGGPSLVGVLAVHCGPGVLALVAGGLWVRRRRGPGRRVRSAVRR